MEDKEKIRKYMESNFVVFDEDTQFSDDDDIFQLGYLNSLFAMQLLTYIQNEFDIVIDDEDIDIRNFSTVNNILRLVRKKKEEVV